MGLALQMIGVLSVVVSLVYNITAIMNGSLNTVGVLLLVIGVLLVKIGRKIYKKQNR